MIKMILFIALGGALGTFFRLGVNSLVQFSNFPIWTLMENVIGSFFLGILTGYVLEYRIPDHWKNALGVGFCGSFTTMSTFAYDFHYLIFNGKLFPSVIYVFGSVIAGVLLAILGLLLGQRLGESQQKKGKEIEEK